ncbi:Uncharacterised protein [uncultured archaeon]|nr:Uncharacterised protein [uncultured archaeon]
MREKTGLFFNRLLDRTVGVWVAKNVIWPQSPDKDARLGASSGRSWELAEWTGRKPESEGLQKDAAGQKAATDKKDRKMSKQDRRDLIESRFASALIFGGSQAVDWSEK